MNSEFSPPATQSRGFLRFGPFLTDDSGQRMTAAKNKSAPPWLQGRAGLQTFGVHLFQVLRFSKGSGTTRCQPEQPPQNKSNQNTGTDQCRAAGFKSVCKKSYLNRGNVLADENKHRNPNDNGKYPAKN